MKELTIDTTKLDWSEAPEYPKGTMEKLLTKDSDGNLKATILNIPAGWTMNSHAHVVTEFHYVLEGEYKSGDNTYPAGTFRVIPAHTEHGPFSSEKGAVVLVTWCRGNGAG